MLKHFPVILGLFLLNTLNLMAETSTNPSSSTPTTTPATTQTAVFAGGCFWCIQPFFDQTPGVIHATVGYTGGHVPNPTYERVSVGTTGHREAIKVDYDPTKVSYEQLLEVYWQTIDPLDAGGQFYDRGEQYKTAIYYNSPEQKAIAEKSKADKAKMLGKTVATDILPAKEFYAAESYHQSYYKKSAAHFNAYEKASGREEKLHNIWQKK
jgi:methionine-S-sulfoxide reductase